MKVVERVVNEIKVLLFLLETCSVTQALTKRTRRHNRRYLTTRVVRFRRYPSYPFAAAVEPSVAI